MLSHPKYSKTVVVSAHGDTNWTEHSMEVREVVNKNGEKEVEYFGHMDNFGGVYGAMQAYFSGRLPKKHFRLEITYDEETTMEGARNVAETLTPADVVIVIDVTGTRTDKDITIEKCPNQRLRKFIGEVLAAHQPAISFDLYAGCPDPVCSQDETDVYRHYTDYVFFLGLPVRGGDYNDGPVHCWKRSVDGVKEAVIALTNAIVEKFDTSEEIKKLETRSILSASDKDLESEIDLLNLQKL